MGAGFLVSAGNTWLICGEKPDGCWGGLGAAAGAAERVGLMEDSNWVKGFRLGGLKSANPAKFWVGPGLGGCAVTEFGGNCWLNRWGRITCGAAGTESGLVLSCCDAMKGFTRGEDGGLTAGALGLGAVNTLTGAGSLHCLTPVIDCPEIVDDGGNEAKFGLNPAGFACPALAGLGGAGGKLIFGAVGPTVLACGGGRNGWTFRGGGGNLTFCSSAKLFWMFWMAGGPPKLLLVPGYCGNVDGLNAFSGATFDLMKLITLFWRIGWAGGSLGCPP